MDKLKQQIAEVEDWLREHPYAERFARHDMILKLADLKEQLDVAENLTQVKN